jgi:PAS domain S-box-containing protein
MLDLPQQPVRRTQAGHAVAVLSVAAAIVVAELITHLLHAEAIASTMLCAVIFSAWFGGLGSALVATGLALVAFHYYLVPPVNSFVWKHGLFVLGIPDTSRLLVFLVTSVVVSLMVSAQRRTTEALRIAVQDQKRVEAALLHSEMYLIEAQRLSHTGSFGWSFSGGAKFWSDEVFRIFQFDRSIPPDFEAFIQRVHPEDRARVQQTIHRASVDGNNFDHEYRLLMSDGSVKYLQSRVRCLKNASGEIEFIGAVSDVTVAKETERKLRSSEAYIRKSEDRLRLVVDTIPTLVWRARPDGVPDFLNQSALDYTGLSPDQTEAGWPRAFHPDDMKSMLVKWSAIRQSGMPGALEARLRRFDGEYRCFLFEAVPLRDEAGRIIKWYGSSTDIEDLKRAEEALRESEQRFRDYAETASDWMWEQDTDHRLTRISEHISGIGLRPSNVTGLARWDIATDVETEPEKWRVHRATINARQPFRDFVYTVNRNGAPTYVRTSGKPIYDEKGNFLGYRGTGTNITASVRAELAEAALREAQAELAHVTRITMLGELTASIAHEVNQPLAAVVANAEAGLRWLDRDPPDVAGARRSAEWVIEDANRASEVVRRVRALAKADTEKVPLDVNDVVREVTVLVKRELVSHRVSLRMALAAGPLNILGDRIQLQQVIINLVMNGIEAMQQVADRPRELVIRSGQDDSRRAFLSVTDFGVGISAEDTERLFRAFFTTKSSGLGMGLSICRSIVEAHGGRLWAYRNEGPGTTFQFTLPLYQENTP